MLEFLGAVLAFMLAFFIISSLKMLSIKDDNPEDIRKENDSSPIAPKKQNNPIHFQRCQKFEYQQREEELKDLFKLWQDPLFMQSAVIYGESGTGKTALLHYIEDIIKISVSEWQQLLNEKKIIDIYPIRPQDYAVAYISLHEPDLTEQYFFQQVVDELDFLENSDTNISKEHPRRDFYKLLNYLSKPSIIMIDGLNQERLEQFDKMFKTDFWNNLRATTQQSNPPPLAFLLSSTENPCAEKGFPALNPKVSPFCTIIAKKIKIEKFKKNNDTE